MEDRHRGNDRIRARREEEGVVLGVVLRADGLLGVQGDEVGRVTKFRLLITMILFRLCWKTFSERPHASAEQCGEISNGLHELEVCSLIVA